MGLGAQALERYAKRAEMGGWDEEVWYSIYQVGQIQQSAGMPWTSVLNSYLTAYQVRPTRLEPLLAITQYHVGRREFQLGYLFSRALVDTPYPEDVLFIERNIYEWELPLEYAVCCYWLGKHAEAIRVNDLIPPK